MDLKFVKEAKYATFDGYENHYASKTVNSEISFIFFPVQSCWFPGNAYPFGVNNLFYFAT